MNRHQYADDGSGYCRCGLPRGNARHIQGQAPARARAAQVKATVAAPTAQLAFTATATSVEAATRAALVSGSVKSRIVAEVATWAVHVGITDDELAQRPHLTGVNVNTLRPRRVELVAAGILRQAVDRDGLPVTRATRGGSPAAAWTLTNEARAVMGG